MTQAPVIACEVCQGLAVRCIAAVIHGSMLSPWWCSSNIKLNDILGVAVNRIDHDTEEAVRRFVLLIAGRYDMAGAIVYGSRARGTHRPDSDADVAVLLKGEHQRVLPTTLAMADVAYDVLLETGINISPLPVWLDEWEHPETYSNPTLLQNIAREGVML